MTNPAAPNRLKAESSLYLRQHAGNPVDWYPWGPEALARAQDLDRPIFLSVGYSACHWCHVMEHESFEDPEIARLLNDQFVSIKVDREERPDLDQIYMRFVQESTGQGGWPMSVFLTPGLRPFYGGTYFPPEDRYGRPGFKRLLHALADYWKNHKGKVVESADQAAEHLKTAFRIAPEDGGTLDESLLRRASVQLERAFDTVHGGFGKEPKFPHPMELRLLLRLHRRFADAGALQMARLTLDRMAMGGIYDHLGGGFHRYSTDARWLVPHYEKMLYDNALLVSSYLESYQASGDPFHREVVVETLDYVRREMTSPLGAFYSTQDADSEGVEGKFFVWSEQQIDEVLGPATAGVFKQVYGVTPEGNWEGHSILYRAKTFEQSARMLHRSEEELRAVLADCRARLFAAREWRVKPGRDEKFLTAWNALMIGAFAQAAQVLDEPSYLETAARAADYLLDHMRSPGGRLLRTGFVNADNGRPGAKLNAYLEDYAYTLDALVTLYEASFDPRWLEAAYDLTQIMIEQFWDGTQAGFYYTGKDHEELITRTKDPYDNSTPSGNSMAVTALLRLSKLTGRLDLAEKAEATLRLFLGLMKNSPLAVGQMLAALDFALGPVEEFVVIGDPDAGETKQVLRALRRAFRPNKVVAFSPGVAGEKTADIVPLLKGKEPVPGTAVATYVCQNFTCQTPLLGAAAVEHYLGR